MPPDLHDFRRRIVVLSTTNGRIREPTVLRLTGVYKAATWWNTRRYYEQARHHGLLPSRLILLESKFATVESNYQGVAVKNQGETARDEE